MSVVSDTNITDSRWDGETNEIGIHINASMCIILPETCREDKVS